MQNVLHSAKGVDDETTSTFTIAFIEETQFKGGTHSSEVELSVVEEAVVELSVVEEAVVELPVVVHYKF